MAKKRNNNKGSYWSNQQPTAISNPVVAETPKPPPTLLEIALSTPNRLPSTHETFLISKQISDDLAEIARLRVDVENRRNAVAVLQDTLKRVENVLKVLENRRKIAEIRMEMTTSLNDSLISVDNISTATPATLLDDFEAIIPEIVNEYNQEAKTIVSDKQYVANKIQDLSRRIEEVQEMKLASQVALNYAISDSENIAGHLMRVEASLVRKRQLIGNIKRVPTEVMAAIFKEVVQSQIESIRQNPSISPLPAAFALSSICSRWRRIVNGIPQLWEFIPLQNPTKDLSPIASLVYERGKGSKRVIFHWPQGGPWHLPLSPSQGGWGGFVTSSQEVHPLERVLSSSTQELANRLDNVEVAELIGRKRQDLPTVNCQIKASRYYILELIPVFPSDIAHQLRSLHLTLSTGLKAAALRAMLRELVGLNTLHLAFTVFIVADLSVEGQRIDLPALQYISTSPKLLDLLLHYYIAAPSLQRLSLETADPSIHGVPGMSLDDTLYSDYPGQIQHFGLRGEDSSNGTISYLRPIMEKCTCVTILELEYRDIEPIMEEIGRDIQLFPLLKRTVLHEARTSNESVGNVFSSRKNAEGCVSIDELVLDRCTGVEEEFCQELRRGGVKVDVYC